MYTPPGFEFATIFDFCNSALGRISQSSILPWLQLWQRNHDMQSDRPRKAVANLVSDTVPLTKKAPLFHHIRKIRLHTVVIYEKKEHAYLFFCSFFAYIHTQQLLLTISRADQQGGGSGPQGGVIYSTFWRFSKLVTLQPIRYIFMSSI